MSEDEDGNNFVSSLIVETKFHLKNMTFDDGMSYDHKCVICEEKFKRRYVGTIQVTKTCKGKITVNTYVHNKYDENQLCVCRTCFDDFDCIE